MYIYTYLSLYIYIYVYIYIHTNVYVCIYIYIHTYTDMHTYICCRAWICTPCVRQNLSKVSSTVISYSKLQIELFFAISFRRRTAKSRITHSHPLLVSAFTRSLFSLYIFFLKTFFFGKMPHRKERNRKRPTPALGCGCGGGGGDGSWLSVCRWKFSKVRSLLNSLHQTTLVLIFENLHLPQQLLISPFAIQRAELPTVAFFFWLPWQWQLLRQQCDAVCCSVWHPRRQNTAVHYHTLQDTARHCKTLLPPRQRQQ